ncbi:type II toxin-antitoxin system VapC family toxin [Bosea caraganae]|uniref:Ribonuclease VapC n=1 Tax=Bosea caraganae TaxID=2763117 RepID=A0A370KXX3_9HYPH|nr:type II toxin-antitoxin system VapC family toxin [Bosea caraganae]RDJ19849.1 type II toxin-antitoxin system VapC family toxin [Bosea caraganae]RDJ25579.1 type II toxin-antitoxin system VapC family toxin [Bosea caraganae]
MFIDASALTAMLTDETDAHELLARLQTAAIRVTSPLAVWETTIAVARILGLPVSEAGAAVEDYLKLTSIAVIGVAPESRRGAIDAYDRYGKGRHVAGLNFGDCFAYACARQEGLPLLFKGSDFPQTDIEAA